MKTILAFLLLVSCCFADPSDDAYWNWKRHRDAKYAAPVVVYTPTEASSYQGGTYFAPVYAPVYAPTYWGGPRGGTRAEQRYFNYWNNWNYIGGY